MCDRKTQDVITHIQNLMGQIDIDEIESGKIKLDRLNREVKDDRRTL